MGSIYKSCQSVLIYLGDGTGLRERANKDRIERHSPPPPITFWPNLTKVPLKSTEASSESFEALGESTSDILEVFRFIQGLSRSGHLEKLAYIETHGYADASRPAHGLFEALRKLTHAPCTPWWTRIWVVQEAVFPPQATLFYGAISAPWDMFAKGALNFSRHSQKCCASTI